MIRWSYDSMIFYEIIVFLWSSVQKEQPEKSLKYTRRYVCTTYTRYQVTKCRASKKQVSNTQGCGFLARSLPWEGDPASAIWGHKRGLLQDHSSSEPPWICHWGLGIMTYTANTDSIGTAQCCGHRYKLLSSRHLCLGRLMWSSL